MCLKLLVVCVYLFSFKTDAFYVPEGDVMDKEAPVRSRVGSPSGVFVGSWLETRRGRRFRAYRGIRYAEPPTGERRFKPPQPIFHYPDRVDASAEGPACPMPAPPGYVTSEDCLRLNVYTGHPGGSSRLLPVVVFIHPGAFYSFSGRSDAFGPLYIMDRDIVLVTINYRLGSLGFLSTGHELAPGNNGLKDQVEALRWIQRNIAAFGGDPNLVTIAGCSAGATSVMLHMVSPMSKGLFHRAILMSGSPFDKAPLPNHQRHLAEKQARLLGCPTYSTKAILDCLRTKPAQQIADTLDGFFEFGFDPILVWSPVVELGGVAGARFLPAQPARALRTGRAHAVPAIVTQTTNELYWKAFTIMDNATLLSSLDANWTEIAPISFLLPKEGSAQASAWLKEAYLDGRRLKNDTVSARRLGKLYGDALIGFGVHRLANLLCRNSPQPVYYGEFAYIGDNSFYQDSSGQPLGVSHQDDLLYLFSAPYRFPPVAPNSTDNNMVDKMTAIWYNFARYGNPNPREDTPELSSLSWPIMTAEGREYLRISTSFSSGSRLFEAWFDVWEHIYPIDYDPDRTVIGIPIYSTNCYIGIN